MTEETKVAHELGEIKGTLVSIKETLEKGAMRFDRHDERIRKLENRQYWYAGAAAAAAGGIVSVLKKLGYG